jgi:hypothetical protein
MFRAQPLLEFSQFALSSIDGKEWESGAMLKRSLFSSCQEYAKALFVGSICLSLV